MDISLDGFLGFLMGLFLILISMTIYDGQTDIKSPYYTALNHIEKCVEAGATHKRCFEVYTNKGDTP